MHRFGIEIAVPVETTALPTTSSTNHDQIFPVRP